MRILGSIAFILLVSSCSQQEEKIDDSSDEPSELEDYYEDDEEDYDGPLYFGPDDIKFVGTELCKDEEGRPVLLGIEVVNEHMGRGPYDTVRSYSADSTYVKYKIVADCCLIPVGRVTVTENKVYLFGTLEGYYPCDCYCEYQFEYWLPGEVYRDKEVVMGSE